MSTYRILALCRDQRIRAFYANAAHPILARDALRDAARAEARAILNTPKPSPADWRAVSDLKQRIASLPVEFGQTMRMVLP